MRRVVAVVVVLAAVGATAWWWLRPRLTDEQQVVRTILKVRRAVETKNAGQFLACISDEYDDGTLKKRDITQMVVTGFRVPDPFRADVETPAIRILGDRAIVDVKVRFWIGQPGAAGETAKALQVHAELVRTLGGWRVIRASGWEPATDVGE
jgi:hypothetical protein